MNSMNSFSSEDRERLGQELLELHFGCHSDPDALLARLQREPALQELQREVLAQARLLEQAAMPAQAPLRLRAGEPVRARWFQSPWKRLLCGAAAAAVACAVFGGPHVIDQWRLRAGQRAQVAVTVSAPRAVPAATPWTFTVQSENLLGEAVPGSVQWTVRTANGTEWTGTTESRGNATISLPPSLEVPRELAIAMHGGGQRIERKLDFEAALSAPLVHLGTDKPVYRPGDVLRARALLLDRTTLAAWAGGESLGFRVLDARGTKLFEQGPTRWQGQANGVVAACEWSVPAELPGGDYELELFGSGGLPAEREPFVVRSYEPPRLRKELALDRTTYQPGERGTAELQVERLGGGLPQGALVRASLVVDGDEVWTEDGVLGADGRTRFQFAVPVTVARGEARFVARVTDGGVVESALKPFVVPTGRIELGCYPEGGVLVAGIESRLYLEATDPLDRAADCSGQVRDDRGAVVATFRTEHQGRTTCTFVPETGRRYSARIDGQEREFAVPEVAAQGLVLRTEGDGIDGGAALAVQVRARGDGPWLVGAFCRGVLLAQSTVTPDGAGAADQRVELALPASAQGVLRVTAFNRRLEPVAERLVQRRATRNIAVELSPATASVAPGRPQTVRVRTRDEQGKPLAALLGVSVVDAAALAMGLEPQVDLVDRSLLFADVERGVELRDFLRSDARSPHHVDLLLGTRGWRRFAWRNDAAAQTVLAAHGEFGENLLAREGFAQTPQVDSNRSEAWAAVAGLRDGLWQGERRAEAALGFSVLGLLLLLVGEFGALLQRSLRHRGPLQQFVGAGAMVGVIGITVFLVLPNSLGSRLAGALAPQSEAAGTWGEPFADGGVVRNFRQGIGGFGAAGEPEEESIIETLDTLSPLNSAFFPSAGGIVARDSESPDAIYIGLGPSPGRSAVDLNGFGEDREYIHRRAATTPGRSDLTELLFWNPLLLTDERGEAEFTFDTSDRVTTWTVRADASGGGRVGAGRAEFTTVLPLHVEAKLPTATLVGDRLEVPIAIALDNGTGTGTGTGTAADAALTWEFAGARGTANVALRDGRGRHLLALPAEVQPGRSPLRLLVQAGGFRDAIQQHVEILPRGFPQRRSHGGTLQPDGSVTFRIAVPERFERGSARAHLQLYPSPIALLGAGLDRLVREPHGCFEQASSANYPNTLVLTYLEASGDDLPLVAARAHELLPRGYDKIAGYECRQRGYEWFGADPGHEALTAYGLLEFQDMRTVHRVDQDMVARTSQWLLARRDGQGGFQRGSQSHSFGAAPGTVTTPYIVYALLHAGTPAQELARELDGIAARVATTQDGYELALSALALHRAGRTEAAATRARLVALQQPDGRVPGTTTSITSSGGRDLQVETTGWALTAFLDDPALAAPARKAAEFLQQQGRNGSFGATQATICALRALTLYAQSARASQAPGTLRVFRGDALLAEAPFAKGQTAPVSLELFDKLQPGEQELRLELQGGGAPMPWSCELGWHSDLPSTDPNAAIAIATTLRERRIEEGRTVALDVRVTNRTEQGQPMTLAIVGIPAGLEITTAVLDDLKRGGRFDLWELRGQDLALYWRGMAPGEQKELTLDLLARIPGRSTAPASRSYLYYTPDAVHWAAGVAIEVLAAR